MNNCNDYIEDLYNSPKINNLIAKIEPADLRDDLKQELAVCLLEYPCVKIAHINSKNELPFFAARIILNMAASKTSPFFKKYRKKPDELRNAISYLKANLGLPGINLSFADTAAGALSRKMAGTLNENHEAKLFTTYIEMRSCAKVAAFYGIPTEHVKFVVRKVREELKTTIKKTSC
jgi:hypothetical protein